MHLHFFPPRLLPPGHHAPDFRLLDHHGRSISLQTCHQNAQGVIILFIPSDFLPGDLQLLKRYQAAHEQFQNAGITLLTLSGINWERLYNLGKRLDLPFSLVFDPCCRYAKAYQTMWVPKFINGRSAFAIHSNGTILAASHHKAQMQPEQMLQHFQSLPHS